MLRLSTLTLALSLSIFAAFLKLDRATAATVMPLQILQLEKLLGDGPLARKVHGWHCRDRYGPYGWHRHRRACRGYDDDDFDYDSDDDFDPYFDGGSIIIRPGYREERRRVRKSCRRAQRDCRRTHGDGTRRYRKCVRKFDC